MTPTVSPISSFAGLPMTSAFRCPRASAHLRAPGPAKPLISSSSRSTQILIGFGVSSIAMTNPRRPSPVCREASVRTEPSVRTTLPVPALKTGSSSSRTQASTAASIALPPASRMARPTFIAGSRLARRSGPAPAPPCATIAGLAIRTPLPLGHGWGFSDEGAAHAATSSAGLRIRSTRKRVDDTREALDDADLVLCADECVLQHLVERIDWQNLDLRFVFLIDENIL